MRQQVMVIIRISPFRNDAQYSKSGIVSVVRPIEGLLPHRWQPQSQTGGTVKVLCPAAYE